MRQDAASTVEAASCRFRQSGTQIIRRISATTAMALGIPAATASDPGGLALAIFDNACRC
jgi:hypothetical protein